MYACKCVLCFTFTNNRFRFHKMVYLQTTEYFKLRNQVLIKFSLWMNLIFSKNKIPLSQLQKIHSVFLRMRIFGYFPKYILYKKNSAFSLDILFKLLCVSEILMINKKKYWYLFHTFSWPIFPRYLYSTAFLPFPEVCTNEFRKHKIISLQDVNFSVLQKNASTILFLYTQGTVTPSLCTLTAFIWTRCEVL